MTTLPLTARDVPAADVDATAMADVAVGTAGLGVRLGDRIVLRDVNIRLRRGATLVLLGHNGAGKSTLLNVMATLTPVSRGGLWLLGEKATRTRQATALRARIGMIGHQPMLYRDLSALENLVFFGKLYGVAKPAKRAAMLLDRVALADRAHDAVKTFSRGMTQRVAIARALMHEPDLLLADEPFSGLDLASMDVLERLLLELRTEGKAIVVSHHDIRHALTMADHIVLMRQGRVAINRPTHELCERYLRREVMA